MNKGLIMRMFDPDTKKSIRNLQLYLSPYEAMDIVKQLEELLKNPEAKEHFHVFCENSGREISCSLLTKHKLSDLSGYTNDEQRILLEK